MLVHFVQTNMNLHLTIMDMDKNRNLDNSLHSQQEPAVVTLKQLVYAAFSDRMDTSLLP